MKKDILHILSLVLILFISLFLLQIIENIKFKNEFFEEKCIFVPAISNNIGILTKFCLKIINGSGRVFINIPNIFESIYQLSFLIAKNSVCKIYEECNKYDYIFYTDEKIKGEGFSATAALSFLILSALNNKEIGYSVTGFIVPNGLILPVSGITQKLEAAKKKKIKLIAPSNFSSEIIQAYSIIDLENILLNKNYSFSIEIPEKYYKILKEISFDICENITNETIKLFLEKESYYTAASLCFIEKSEKEKINIDINILNKKIRELENKVNNIKCNNYNCEELKFQVLFRINLSKEIDDISKKYWRFKTAEGWYKMLLALKDIQRKDTCKKVDEDFEIISNFIEKNLTKPLSCFEKREILSEIYYNMINNFDFDINNFVNSVERYLYYLYNKNGFSITSYNYFTYGKDLIKINQIDRGILFLIYAINYAI